MNRYYSILLLSILIFTSCSENDDDDRSSMPIQLNTSIYNRPRISKQLFHEGDKVGVYLVDYTNDTPGVLGNIFQTRYFNIEYAMDDAFWYAPDGQEIYIGNGYADLYTYYPYDAEMSRVPGKTDLTAYPFQIQTDQSAHPTGSDFLWAKSTRINGSDQQANIIFKHLMSCFEINLFFNDRQEIPTDPQLKIYNTQTACTINMRTGMASANGQTSVLTPFSSAQTAEGYDFSFNAIIIPQTITRGTPLFSVTVNNRTWIYEAESDINILAQDVYTFNMTVNTSSI